MSQQLILNMGVSVHQNEHIHDAGEVINDIDLDNGQVSVVLQKSHQGSQMNGGGKHRSVQDSQSETDLLFSPPLANTSSQQATPTKRFRHVSTWKLVDWGLSVRKKWPLLNDSNLSRIPEHCFENLQIDSYPRARFRQAEAIISKAHIHTEVEKVFLAFGINNKSQKFKETAVQLQRAIKMAHDKVPKARVWVPLINFSKSLKREEQVTLQGINNYILIYN